MWYFSSPRVGNAYAKCLSSLVWLSHLGLFVSMIELHHWVMDLEELVWSPRGSSRGPLEGSGCQPYNGQIGEAGVSAAPENKPLDFLLTVALREVKES